MDQDPEIERIKTNAAKREAELLHQIEAAQRKAKRDAAERELDAALDARPKIGARDVVRRSVLDAASVAPDGRTVWLDASGREVPVAAALGGFLAANPVFALDESPAVPGAPAVRHAKPIGQMSYDELVREADRELAGS